MLDAENPSDTTTPPADAEAPADPTAPAAEAPAKKTARKATAKKTTAKTAAKKTTAKKAASKSAAAKKAAAEPVADEATVEPTEAPAKRTPTRKTAAKRTTKKATTKKADSTVEAAADETAVEAPAVAPAEELGAPAEVKPAKRTATRRTAAKKVGAAPQTPVTEPEGETAPAETAAAEPAAATSAPAATSLLFQPPDASKAAPRKRSRSRATAVESPADEATDSAAPAEETPAEEKPAARRSGSGRSRKAAEPEPEDAETQDSADDADDAGEDGESETGDGGRRRRRRGGRRRRKSGSGESADAGESSQDDGKREDRSGNGPDQGSDDDGESGGGSRRRRRRRRTGDDGNGGSDDPDNTVTRVRKPRTAEDEITSLHGSTRLEAKKQRRREGREAGRRRAPIVSEAEFLARREAVERVMVIRQRDDLTQIGVLEDKVLVEHYVARESQASLIGNVYLGRVQNVLPSMEAAFIDIGKGRNAVLYAGEVNWDALGAKNGGQGRKIENVLKSGQPVLVQVSKDPIGHKGARLTSQISLPGRFLVYVPDGTTSGISRKLPDTERNRLKDLLKQIVPESAGVIVRTAAEGASEEELTRDVERLTARWEDIAAKVEHGNAPQLLYGEPDLTLKVVRDLFTEDFEKLVVSGDAAWDTVEGYVTHVAPELSERLEKYDAQDTDVFAAYRIDEQIAKGLDRKVWLPSGGSLVIDRTEAMTVVDVNTGKFTGSGGNLEETVTKNNLEAAEEIVRQLRLRDIGGIIVVDFIDMVLESNRDLVLRRMVECLGRDRTRHQVAEVTSLGLVQMTRKRIGTGLLEAFTETCDHCQGRGLHVHDMPVEPKKSRDEDSRRGGNGGGNAGSGGRGRGRGRGRGDQAEEQSSSPKVPSPKDVAAVAKAENADRPPADLPPDETVAPVAPSAEQEPPTPEAAADATPAVTVDAAAEATSTTVAPEPEEAPAPVTRSRTRQPRRAQRPQGKPEPSSTESTSGEVAVTPDPTPEPAPELSPAPAVAPETPEVPATRVVTTVRRRSARRAAGPPAGLNGADQPASESSDDAGEAGSAAHVPVKKKGARKR